MLGVTEKWRPGISFRSSVATVCGRAKVDIAVRTGRERHRGRAGNVPMIAPCTTNPLTMATSGPATAHSCLVCNCTSVYRRKAIST